MRLQHMAAAQPPLSSQRRDAQGSLSRCFGRQRLQLSSSQVQREMSLTLDKRSANGELPTEAVALDLQHAATQPHGLGRASAGLYEKPSRDLRHA